MSVFASYFWLWSIVGLLGLIFLYAFGAIMSFGWDHHKLQGPFDPWW